METYIGVAGVRSIRQGIGPNGMTLLDALVRNRELFEQTGHYHGITELTLK
jgi:hypothetical protein